MDALVQFFGRTLSFQKEELTHDYLADNLQHDDGSYLRELVDQERAQLAATNIGPRRRSASRRRNVAQERGEVARHGDPILVGKRKIPDRKLPTTGEDVGLFHEEIHETRSNQIHANSHGAFNMVSFEIKTN
jgi:hypothetical protein